MKQRSSSNKAGYWYDEAAAERAVQFFSKCLTHTKGEWAGQPLHLDEWQAEKIIRPLFGWKRKDGTRKYRTAFIMIPRKAGKSTLAAGIANYLLFADGEPGAEVYSAAADREQAAIVFEMAKGMVDASAALRTRSRSFKRSIIVGSTNSSYKVLSSDAYTKHGLSAHGIVVDEVHALPNRELWDVLTTSTGARRQPLTVAITTAGYDRNSLCYELYDYAVKVRDGVIEDEAFLPVIFEAGQEDDWKKPETWRKAHPGLGVSVKEEYFAAECAKAQQLPGYENTFKRLLLNIWTEQNTRWIPLETWDKCGGELPDLSGRVCYAGLDLASTTDIAALVLAFPIAGKVHLLPFFFVPREGIKRRSSRDRVPYEVWARQGLIIPTEGNVIDYDIIRAKINELAEIYQIKEIAVDRWNATQISTQLAGDGFEMIGFGQGFASMSGPTKELERRVLAQEINHGGNPVLRWMASNVSIKQDEAGNMKPDKSKSTERIDGIVAALMALGRAMEADEERPSVYDEGEFAFF
ncbi:terminase large subunit [Noviherbaspirillum galbum]|uniref:Terminase large subunit n=1 Tax=Noviherbaspirillum galbum TaxID=2709383 RepID=A0A6B3SS20_9BURK|nr:terminase TerL endonuclease subunit [Noviherbaspirillum galbum]NEX63451.1 terminase large subunit [Noviherbaspirillum galbum]